MLPSTADGLIQLLCQPGMASAWQTERRATSMFHAGFAQLGDGGYSLIANLPRAWQLVPEWGDWPYLIGWQHDPDGAVLTYCEGDLSVEVADDQTAYIVLLERTTAELAQTAEDAAHFLRRIHESLAASNDPVPSPEVTQ